jgi:hypothetical protein
MHAPNENKDYDIKDSFYEELQPVIDQSPRYYMKILLGNFIVKIGMEQFLSR